MKLRARNRARSPGDTSVDGPLERAAALDAEGRSIDAIRLLTDANRRHADARYERRLVTLRHEAAASASPDPVNPPSEVTRKPGPPAPLPELSPEDLDVERLREGLAGDGCVLIRGLIPAERAEALAAGIDHALADFDEGRESGWYAPFTPEAGTYRVGGRRQWVRASGALWTADSPHMLFELLEVIDESGIGALVTDYLGERPALSANKCTLRRVPVDTNTDWHQDGAFLGRDVRTLNLWLGLSHCGEDAPGLDLVPRRFDEVLETGTEGAYFDWAVSPDVVKTARSDTEVLRPHFAPGDALLFDHLFLHRTAVTPGMTRERHAIETWFFAPSAYPDGQIPLAY